MVPAVEKLGKPSCKLLLSPRIIRWCPRLLLTPKPLPPDKSLVLTIPCSLDMSTTNPALGWEAAVGGAERVDKCFLPFNKSAFACLAEYLEISKACSSEMCATCDGVWWSWGCAGPGAHVETLKGVAVKVGAAGLGGFNLHHKGVYSILFGLLSFLYYFPVKLNSSYVFRAHVYASNFPLPWGF